VIELEGPTYRQVSERLRLKEQREAHNREAIAAWRARHPEATCNDRTALILAELERDFGGGR
jgi:hypothetical protein